MTRIVDTLAAVAAGADAIGMVFYTAASRSISVDLARQIMAILPPFVTPVGLFVDSPAGEILDISKELNLRHVQLHGHETPAVVSELKGLRVLKAVRVDPATLADTLSTWRVAIRDYQINHLAGILLETSSTIAPGGTGVENDWATIAATKASGAFDGLPPMIAAGGLTPANVGNVIRLLRPYAVDVSSGIEISRGLKSRDKMEAFAQAVRQADAEA